MPLRSVLTLLTWLPLLAVLPARAAAPDATAVQWREQAQALEHGSGVARNVDAAISLYCRAAMAGDAAARYHLGWIYANGRGVKRDDAHAAYLFRLAADQGDEPSRNMLALVGPEATKPPCVIQAEVAQAEEESRARAAVEAARIAAQAAAEREALDNRYRALIDSAQRRKILAIVQRLAPEYGIHPGLAVALIRAESNFDPQAVSTKNAQGLMQLIPETAARFRVTKPFDPEQNIRGGMAYLRWLLAYFQGDVDLTVAAYNAGEGAVDRFGGIPPYAETRGYVKRIREVFAQPTHPFDQRISDPSPMLKAEAKPRT
ncbi:transglycosylase SLT domain-containing protein [Hydrogenophaga sp.]|uniref:transglycosylase SLT domain-containing protein n=1 Tax=Hydrogenophaga sp. TaxID=1904254 RepID=UPI0025BA7B5B|nr:transglycosylase SLT domain-containing protein [Hydrogenophaga sp.]